MVNKKLGSFFLASIHFFTLLAFGQGVQFKEEVEEATKTKQIAGPSFGVDVGITTNWNVNRKYIGVADGHYLSVGGKIGGNVDYKKGIHQWTNNLTYLMGFNHTPLMAEWIKSADHLKITTNYSVGFNQWWGYFVAIGLDTSLFAGLDRRPSDVTYIIEEADKRQTVLTGRTLVLTEPFQPLYVQESTGLFTYITKYDVCFWY